MLVKFIIFIGVLAAVVSLAMGLSSLRKGDSKDLFKALKWRIFFSFVVFAFMIFSIWMGWLEPHSVNQQEIFTTNPVD